jgi:23S rRNA (cytosine1962-C5)-methyltransferase
MAIAALFPPFRPELVLHQDEDLLVIDKPFGMATHAPSPDRPNDAVGRLTTWFRERGEDPYLGVHQRLDRDTSGVLLFTRRTAANGAIAKQFEGRSVKKGYVAAVRGKLPPEGVLTHDLAEEPGGTMRVVPKGQRGGARTVRAITRFRILTREGGRVLVACFPETGRTHQLRVQLAAVGVPIVGDVLYGGQPNGRLLLHAHSLDLVHPSGKKAHFEAPIPADFEAWLRGAEAEPLGDTVEITRRLRDAAERRYGLFHAGFTDCLRLANGGGDGLPGVAVDLYGEHLLVHVGAEVPAAARERVLDAAAQLGARGVYLKVRPKDSSRLGEGRHEELAPPHAVRGEDAPPSFLVHELGVAFEVRLGEGMSTGLFLDQRENRRRVRELAAGARVLNLFAYTGAFSVVAAQGGAKSSMTVDVAPGALAWAERNLARVDADPKAHVLVRADALRWLKHEARAAGPFDLALLDPPSFATTKTSRFSAGDDYAELAASVLARLAPGGRLLACTNHRATGKQRFRRTLHEAARLAQREVAQLKDLPEPVDFPAEPGQEPHLKSLLLTLK